MHRIIICSLTVFALFQGTTMAQVGLNNITISTTSDGNISWNANVDGHNRKGYHDQYMLANVCKEEQIIDKDVLVPQTIQSYPSLATDMLFFTGTGYDNFTVTIKDDGGRVMDTEKYFERTSLDVSSYTPGTYSIEIVAEKTGEMKTRKLVKE
jgi:hypothetical protein